MTTVPMHKRQGFVDTSHMTPGIVTLDGRPAVVCGFRNPFATVALLHPDQPRSVEYSWETVERVFDRFNCAFQS